MKIGDKLRGKVTGLQPYGASVALENKETGLIHISEIHTGYVENMLDFVEVNQEVLVQVIDIDEYNGKASLSLRTLAEKNHIPMKRHRFSSDRRKYGFTPLKKSMKTWMMASLDYLENRGQEKS